MRFNIKHEIRGRIRIHIFQKRMTYQQADTLQYYLENIDGVTAVNVYDKTCDATISYKGDRKELLGKLQSFRYENVKVPAAVLDSSGRELNEQYKEKLVNKVIFHYARKFLLPMPFSAIYTGAVSVKYIWKGLQCALSRRIEVPLLDGIAIGVSILRGDMDRPGTYHLPECRQSMAAHRGWTGSSYRCRYDQAGGLCSGTHG